MRKVTRDRSPDDGHADAAIGDGRTTSPSWLPKDSKPTSLASMPCPDERKRRRREIFFQNLQADALAVQMLDR